MSNSSSSVSFPASSHAVINGSFYRDPAYSIWSTVYVDHSGNLTASGPFSYPNASTPFVAAVPEFNAILGEGATLEVVARAEYAAFHEAGVYIASTNEVYFTSNQLNTTNSTEYRFPTYAQFNKISLSPSANGSYEWSTVFPPSSDFILPNGGTIYNGQVLMAVQGHGLDVPSSLVLVNPQTGSGKTMLNNFYGRVFNSINDVAILDLNGTVNDQWVFFTDPPYGYFQGFKPYPSLPAQVYAFHPPSGTIRVVADGFERPNGVQFSEDFKTCYVSDTGFISAVSGDPHPSDGSRPGTIYAFDVVTPSKGVDPRLYPPALTNRRVFAFTDSGMPDGIKVDTQGNVYAGCFDGVHVWNKHGALLGKILLGLEEITQTSDGPNGRGCANMVFVPGGLLMFSEDRMYLAKIKAKGALLS
ncbi:hypothetical protein RSOLAG22IIIB_05933 [Rhizoctonia solani]|uniref:SMP-30/Gluconolactonase/LRE-like region domain-containing protein n=1 Tax=Rhizoctonia solani TaxID=456999 RepID=A0A0K6GAP9_9AGAM|nr:hypothetical protein RSOLAG22IIIB_05933 [Rhizoctonia solani]